MGIKQTRFSDKQCYLSSFILYEMCNGKAKRFYIESNEDQQSGCTTIENPDLRLVLF